MNMHAETPHQLATAVVDERRAADLAEAFRKGPLPPSQSAYLQNAMRSAWEADAKTAMARLARMAMMGADGIKAGSRGNAARSRATEKAKPKASRIELESRARRALILAVLRDKPSTKREVMLATSISSVSVTTAFKQLIRDGQVVRSGKDGACFVYAVTA